jgi:hypothetical protein
MRIDKLHERIYAPYEPHRGFSWARRMTSCRTRSEIGGRPVEVVGEVQRRRTMHRCQPSSVSGRTRNTDERTRGSSRLSAASSARSVGLQAEPGMLAAQHRQLVAEHQGLDLLGLRRPEAEQDQLEAAAQRQVDERPDHNPSPRGEGEQGRRIVVLGKRYLLVMAMIDFWHPTGCCASTSSITTCIGRIGRSGLDRRTHLPAWTPSMRLAKAGGADAICSAVCCTSTGELHE